MAGHAELEARRIEHGADVVDVRDDVFDVLTDAGIVRVPSGVAEDVCGVEDVVRGESGVCVAEESGDRGDAAGFVGGAVERHLCGGVGEADVVVLDFVEAAFGCFDPDGDVVGADFGLGGVSPAEVLAVFEECTAGEMDGEVGAGGGEGIVFEGDDAGDHVDAHRMAGVGEVAEGGDGGELASADGFGEGDLARVDEHSVVALDVNDERIGASLTDDVERGVADGSRGYAVLGEVESFDGEGRQGQIAAVFLGVCGGEGCGPVAGSASHDALDVGGDRVVAGGVDAERLAVEGHRSVGDGLMGGGVDDVDVEGVRGASGKC